jgi:hypothetical protein
VVVQPAVVSFGAYQASSSSVPSAAVNGARVVVTPEPVLIITSYSTATLGEGDVPPVVVIAPSGNSRETTPPTAPSTSTAPGAQTSSPTAPTAPVPRQTINSTPDPSPPVIPRPVITSVPPARHVIVSGALAPENSSFTVAIPVGSATQEIGVSVQPPREAGADGTPVVGQVVLVDKNGVEVARVGPLWDPQANAPPQAVTLSLANAPDGGNLEVMIAAPASATSSAGMTTGSGTANSNLPFTLDVQRLDATGLAPGSTVSAHGAGGIAPLPATVVAGGATREPVSLSPETEGSGPTPSEPAPQAPLASATDQSISSDDPSSEGFNVRVAAGPLASRSAGALGPALATVLFDHAPQVDRHERALADAIGELWSEGIDGIGAGRIDVAKGGRSRFTTTDGRSGEGGRPSGPVVAVSGLGAFPLEVTTMETGSRQARLQALLAIVPAALASSGLPDQPGVDRLPPGGNVVTSATLPPPAPARRLAPDALTLACGLALGLGLSTSPLLPDFLSFMQTRRLRRGAAVPHGTVIVRRTPWPRRALKAWRLGRPEFSRSV